jgi:hypothetical protein
MAVRNKHTHTHTHTQANIRTDPCARVVVACGCVFIPADGVKDVENAPVTPDVSVGLLGV